ncbi:MAG TPA: carboxypeptidase regulatory-like domain-containing protein [Hymenobacter sp.]|nr:carboxypeptidase regulatory-like domain-containing protein [Hymenobacter sp.]
MRFLYTFLALICVSQAASAQSNIAVSSGKSLQADASAAQDPHSAPPAISCPTVRGRILDHNNKGLVGATVAIKGTYEVFTTNSEGSYVVNIPVTGAQVLQVSAGGYTEKEIRLQDCSPITVSLEPLPSTRIKQHGKLKGIIKRTGDLKIRKP